jgi:hypothetical protein
MVVAFEVLYEFTKENNNLPKRSEIYKSIKIGNFLGHLLGGKRFKSERLGWLESLKGISPELRQNLDEIK